MKFALDRRLVRCFLEPVESEGEGYRAALLLRELAVDLHVPPLVAEEIELDGDAIERRWRENARLIEIPSDDFLLGCAAGIARRYLDYYPDPRDCRLVAEAECTKMDSLLTLNEELIAGLADRVENIRIERPQDAAERGRRNGGE